MPVFALSEELVFPPPRLAADDGLLAVGGDLSRERLLLAYRMGIFPWYSEGEPILWWSPDPRLVLYPREFRIPRSLAKVIRRADFTVSMDQAFQEVIGECARVRRESGEGTWIVPEMLEAYCGLLPVRRGPLGGSVAGREAGRRAIRGCARAEFFRRVHVHARHRCLQGGPGRPGESRAGPLLRPDRLPGDDRPPDAPRGARDSAGAFPGGPGTFPEGSVPAGPMGV